MASVNLVSPLRTSCRVLGTKCIPSCKPRLGVVRLASIAMTFSPKSDRAAARLEVRVVLPTPPFPEVTTINLVIISIKVNGHLKDLFKVYI